TRLSVDGYSSVVVDPTGCGLDACERLSALDVVGPSKRDGEADLYVATRCRSARWPCDVIDIVIDASTGGNHQRDNNYDDDRSCPRCQPARPRLHTRMVSNSLAECIKFVLDEFFDILFDWVVVTSYLAGMIVYYINLT